MQRVGSLQPHANVKKICRVVEAELESKSPGHHSHALTSQLMAPHICFLILFKNQIFPIVFLSLSIQFMANAGFKGHKWI